MTRLSCQMGILLLAGLAFGVFAQPADTTGRVVSVQGERARIAINRIGGLPVLFRTCSGVCDSDGSKQINLMSEGSSGGRLQWKMPGNPDALRRLQLLEYSAVVEETDEGSTVTLIAERELDGRLLHHDYRLSRNGHVLEMDLDLPAGVELQWVTGADFVPEPLPGFGAWYGNVWPVIVNADGQQSIEGDPEQEIEILLQTDEWLGIRNRFWVGLLRPTSGAAAAHVNISTAKRPRLNLSAVESSRLAVTFYGGPVELESIKAVDPDLTGMLFAALWNWLRALTFGMLYLLKWIDSGIGNIGLSIVLLSLAVKVLMWPLTRIADRLQEDVNKTEALLQPRLAEIKRSYKGEDAHRRTLAVYKEHGVHPLYTLKSLLGFLIQIPIFIAAFDMLGESFALNQASFLWIENLAAPDRWLPLPVNLPFFGAHLNLLPVLMTGFTVLASRSQTDPALTPELLRRQRLRLYLMAGAFFLLFYTFPAGMVLYWTTNNVIHLVKLQLKKRVFQAAD